MTRERRSKIICVSVRVEFRAHGQVYVDLPAALLVDSAKRYVLYEWSIWRAYLSRELTEWKCEKQCIQMVTAVAENVDYCVYSTKQSFGYIFLLVNSLLRIHMAKNYDIIYKFSN